jgi:precorrin-3B C17-methyltransferase
MSKAFTSEAAPARVEETRRSENGVLFILGLGPGPERWLVPEAADALAQADALIGYKPYTDRVPERAGLERFASDNRVEVERARHALELAQAGRKVAVVSGGDAGVFGMASAVFEAMETGDPAWRHVDIRITPGVSAVMAAAARLGAPLGHDFCVISLSDNLKPWEVIARRLKAAAQGDFVIALYNPASKARPRQIFEAFDLLRGVRNGATPVAFARAVGRPDERLIVTDLAQADPAVVDMATLVLIGSSETRFVARPEGEPWVYTPRSYGAGR